VAGGTDTADGIGTGRHVWTVSEQQSLPVAGDKLQRTTEIALPLYAGDSAGWLGCGGLEGEWAHPEQIVLARRGSVSCRFNNSPRLLDPRPECDTAARKVGRPGFLQPE